MRIRIGKLRHIINETLDELKLGVSGAKPDDEEQQDEGCECEMEEAAGPTHEGARVGHRTTEGRR